MSSEKFHDTYAKSIHDILNGVDQIIVPNFQRNYAWVTNKFPNQVPELWEDVTGKFANAILSNKSVEGEYLIGPMVFVKDENEKKLQIVDGQQRLATLTMILCIVRDVVIELEQGTVSLDSLSSIINLIEKRNIDLQTNNDVHVFWRLSLNSTDRELYCNMVQKYECEINDEFCDPGDKYKKISRKIEYYKKSLKNGNTDYEDSQELLIKAYLHLYDKVQDALITNFETDTASENIVEKITNDASDEVDSELRSDPKRFGLSSDFFSDDLDGLDSYINNNWSGENLKQITGRCDIWNNKRKTKTQKSFEDWRQYRINEIKNKTQSSSQSFKSIRENLVSERKNTKTATTRKQNLPRLKNFCKSQIAKYLFSIRVIVKDEEDAYQIFETINARGQELSKSNLVKNWVLKQIRSESDKIEFSKKWDDIISRLSKIRKPDSFLRESLRSRGYPDPKSNHTFFDSYPIQNYSGKIKANANNLFKIIKNPYLEIKYVKEGKKVEDLREEYAKYYIQIILNNDSKISNELDEPEKYFPKATLQDIIKFRDPRPALIDMNNLNAEYIRLPIMTAYRKWTITSDEFIILVKFLVSFFFRYKTIRDKNATRLESLMLKVCEEIENGTNKDKDLNTIVKFLIQEDDQDEFADDFTKRFDPPSEDEAKFVLQHITTFLGSPHDDVAAIDGLTLEHILPQNPRTNSKKPIENWVEIDFFKNYDPTKHVSLRRFNKWHDKLGNLTLLKIDINSKIKNNSFLSKRDFMDNDKNPPEKNGYNSSKLEINIQTVMKDQETNLDRKEWNIKSIMERGAYFADLATKIWALPQIICSNSSCKFHSSHPKIKDIEINKINDEKCSNCGKDLILIWPVVCGPEYKIPS